MKVLLTGANGYIGRRLLPLLIQEGHEVYALVRNVKRMSLCEHQAKHVKLIKGDLSQLDSLSSIPDDIDVAYYLVHSMSDSKKDFVEKEKACAENFITRLEKTSVQQVIYLSGLTSDDGLSDHMQSRQSVAEILEQSSLSTTIFRAGVIIGSGSASFEIIRDLVEKLPVMVAPRWISNQCQPIGIVDVLHYLVHAVMNPKCFNKAFDIGGPCVLTYYEMLMGFAKARDLKRFILSVPVLTPKLSSYWLYFITSTNFSLSSTLVHSLINNAICHETSIQEAIPHKCMSYDTALERAFIKIEQNAVVSSWKDAMVSGSISPDLKEYIEVPHYGCVHEVVRTKLRVKKEESVNNVWSLGGENGWPSMNFAWKIRGAIDIFFSGVGLNRGRTHDDHLEEGDALDFWRVILADKDKGHLLLYAEMKLPGEAWLEYHFEEERDGSTLVQTATFRPKGVLGRLYWYAMKPFHFFIFSGMAHTLAGKWDKPTDKLSK